MRKCISLLLFILLLLVSDHGTGQEITSKFADPVIRTIHDLADQRDMDALFPYLRDSNLIHRGEALMCLGSVQAKGIEDSIMLAIQSDIDGIRMAGAFALGQTYDSVSAGYIRRQLEIESKPLVKGMFYDALGKTGSVEDLDWLAEQELSFQESEGQAMGIFRFALRNIVTQKGSERMMLLCMNGSSVAGLTYASYFLGRYATQEWLAKNAIAIRQLFNNERDELVKSQLIKAVIKGEDEEAWPLVEQVLKSDADYRIKVNVLSSLRLIPWNKAGKLVYEIATGDHLNLAVAAAEAIGRYAVYTDLSVHLAAIDKAKHWRPRAELLRKALELVSGKKALVKKVEKSIYKYYELSQLSSEKALLLKALASDPGQYAFVEKELTSTSDRIISTAAVETLTIMRKQDGFANVGENLGQEFLKIFKRSILSGDVAQVTLAAGILMDPELPYKEEIKDLDFLKTALDQSQRPDQIEARNMLAYTLAYFMDKKLPPLPGPGYNHPINWDRIMKLEPRQQVAIITSKGEFIVQLNVNWCPGTVGAFIELIDRGFYNNKTIHRVVPNFVMQDGCPNGDGWGGPEFTIRSEFTPAPFITGTLGMASSGKDTEGSQWYITHSPTPHLDAKYTNFGYVVSGMDVVHQLGVGDQIIRMEIITE